MNYLERKPSIYKTALLSVMGSTIDALQNELPESLISIGDNGLFVDIDGYMESDEIELMEAIIAESGIDIGEIGMIHFTV